MTTVTEILKAAPCRQCPPNECSYAFRNRLSLTRELNPGGCAHYYMNSAFPHLASDLRSLHLPKGLYLITKAPKGWESFMGTAFDRRLRYEYELDYDDGVVRAGAALLRNSGIQMDEELASPDLDKRSLYAAVADIEYRSGRGETAWNALNRGGDELERELVADCQALLETAHHKLNLSNPTFGPTFSASRWIGGGDADIIDGGCLIDVKCVAKPSSATKFVSQVIAYALLDVKNEYDLDSVGIYLARQGILWKIPLKDIAKMSGKTISELRAQAPWVSKEDIWRLKLTDRVIELLIRQHALSRCSSFTFTAPRPAPPR